jgi:hypothetical protein
MAEAVERSEWNRAAAIIAQIHNANVVHKRDLITFMDIHPYHVQKNLLSNKAARSAEPTHEELMLLRSSIKGMGHGR